MSVPGFSGVQTLKQMSFYRICLKVPKISWWLEWGYTTEKNVPRLQITHVSSVLVVNVICWVVFLKHCIAAVCCSVSWTCGTNRSLRAMCKYEGIHGELQQLDGRGTIIVTISNTLTLCYIFLTWRGQKCVHNITLLGHIHCLKIRIGSWQD